MPTKEQVVTKPEDCPRFYTCSAPICLLDERWRSAVHLPGERVCPYLLASGKAGAAEHYAGDPVYAVCLARLPEVTARHPDIRRRVERASRSGLPGAHRRGKRVGQKGPAECNLDTVTATNDPEAT